MQDWHNYTRRNHPIHCCNDAEKVPLHAQSAVHFMRNIKTSKDVRACIDSYQAYVDACKYAGYSPRSMHGLMLLYGDMPCAN